MGADLTRLRRFALSVGLVLFTYSIAGVELETPVRIAPLGIPFLIKRPNLLGVGLLLASLYACVRYWYFGYLVSISPSRARRFLLDGQFPPGTGKDLRGDKSLMIENAALIFGRYFPAMKLKAQAITLMQTTDLEGTRFSGFEMPPLSLKTRALIWIENLDYAAPVWINLLAIAVYGIRAV